MNAKKDEEFLRRHLGIPGDAEHVIVFAESSHWDPDWLLTSEEYFDRFVRHNLDAAIEGLLREPRRVYSIECMFFLRLYWERCPEQQEKVRGLVNEDRLRLTSSGVTTADTLLPSAEAILRDFLIGQEWLRANGMTPEPRLAYFTDSFGCSPALPSLLNAAGFDRTAITRIDGMFFMGCDLEPPRRFPRPGSSAELLLNKERTLDFIWRDRTGAEVLCHWNAFTYGQGDLLAFRGLSRIYLFPMVFPDRSERNVARRVKQFAAQLAPYSRTPYMFCPIGFDFVAPIPDLVALLDRHNRIRYPASGIWAVNAGLDDYLTLVDCHREQLPVLELDPNPYWTGFYTARPTLKKRCHVLVDQLLLAEQLSFLPENEGAEQTVAEELQDAWWTAAVSNHHDFVTGTSPDRVVEEEQVPWLELAATTARSAVERLSVDLLRTGPVTRQKELPRWSSQGGRIRIKTPYYVVELAEETGGTIVGAYHPDTQVPLLAGASNDLISYRDSGGLWRMGCELWGGTWKEDVRASDRPARLQVREHNDGLDVSCVAELNGETVRRLMWFCENSPVIRFRVEGRAAERRTVTVRFATKVSANELVMDTPGGLVVRPPQRIYDPTFWPLQQFVHIQDDATGRGVAICQSMPGAIAYRSDGQIEVVALRNATRERVFGLIPIPGNPAAGHEREVYAFDYALLFTEAGDWRDNDIPRVARSMADDPWDAPDRADLRELTASVATTGQPDVWVTAVKPASRGDGLIVRLYTLAPPGLPVSVTVRHRTVKGALLCDARERDIESLEVRGGAAHLIMPATIASVRLIV